MDGGPLTNGGFSNGLNGWTPQVFGGGAAPGTVAAVGGRAQFLEGDSFLVELRQSFMVPANATRLHFDVFQIPGFDQGAQFIPDAFEAALLDANMQSVVPTWHPMVTSFFNLQESGGINSGPGVVVNGSRVSVDISSVPPGTTVTLFFDLIGADSDMGSGVQVDGVGLQTPPFFQAPSPCNLTLSAPFGLPFSFNVAAADLDPLDVVGIVATASPAGSNLVATAGNPATGVVSWTPTAAQAGLHTFVFAATDGAGAMAACTVLVQVDSGSPSFSATTPCAQVLPAAVGIPIAFVATATDPDPGDILVLSATGIPPGASLVPALPTPGNPVTSSFSWTPGPAATGLHIVTFTATDVIGHVALCTVTIDVAGMVANGPPQFVTPACGDRALHASVGVELRVPIVVSDPDAGDQILLAASNLPPGASFVPPLTQAGNPFSTELRWTADAASAHSLTTIPLIADDGNGHAVGCALRIVPGDCLLFVNFTPTSQPIGPGNHQMLVEPANAVVVAVSPQFIPSWNVPNDPFLHGLAIYSQIALYSPFVFPNDPLRLSNGIESIVGVSVTPYGPSAGIIQSATSPPALGAPHSVQFTLLGF